MIINEEPRGKENGIIILGKMRVGKSNLIHHLTGKKVEVKAQNISLTKNAEHYEGILNGKPFLCIDTAGFCDKCDDEQVQNLKEFLSKNIKIKKIFIVINFQSQAFSKELFECFNKIASIFPMPNFWDHVLICYSHYFDQGHKKKENQKLKLEESNKKGFEQLIQILNEKHKIDKVKYENIKKIYYNLYSEEDFDEESNNETKLSMKENNDKYIEEFNNELKLILQENSNPMYNKIKTKTIKNTKFITPQDKNPDILEIRECDANLTEYFDFNNKPFHQVITPLKDLNKLDVKEIVDKNKYLNIYSGGVGITTLNSLLFLGGIILACIPGGQLLGGIAIASASGLGAIAGAGMIVYSDDQLNKCECGTNSDESKYFIKK